MLDLSRCVANAWRGECGVTPPRLGMSAAVRWYSPVDQTAWKLQSTESLAPLVYLGLSLARYRMAWARPIGLLRVSEGASAPHNWYEWRLIASLFMMVSFYPFQRGLTDEARWIE